MHVSVTVEVDGVPLGALTARVVPALGPIRENPRPVVPTPHLFGPNPGKRYLIMAFTMTDTQKVTVAVAVKDAKGNPAQLDGVPEWSTDNTDVLALFPAADGLSCDVLAVGPLGDAAVTFKGDADLGAGVAPIVGMMKVMVTSGVATTVELFPGKPVEQ